MKTIKHILLTLSVIFGSKAFMQTSAVVGAALIAKQAKSQTYIWESSTGRKAVTLYKQISPTSTYPNRWEIFYINKDSLVNRHANWYLDSLKPKNDGLIPTTGKIMWIDPVSGKLKISPASSLPSGSGTLTPNVYNAGYGLTKVGLEPMASFSVDVSVMMSVQRYIDSISIIRTSINTKASKSTSISINGNTQTLASSSLSWTIPAPTFTAISAGSGISISSGSIISNTGILTEIDPTVPSYVKSISTSDISNWNGKLNAPSGSTVQYVNGSGSLSLFPTDLSSFMNGPGYITGYTPTLSISGSSLVAVGGNTVVLPSIIQTSITASGIASVSTSGTNTFNVNVPVSTITGLGAVSVSGSFPNFTVSAPSQSTQIVPASTLAISGSFLSIVGGNTVILPPQPQGTLTSTGIGTITSAGTNSFNINIPQTSLTSGGSATVSGSFPSYTITTPSQTTQVIPPSTLAISGQSLSVIGGNTIIIPSATITATGIATSTTSGLSATINVPAQITPTVTASGIASVTVSGYSTNLSVPAPAFTGTGVSISGTYPVLTFSNTVPDRTVTLTGINGFTVTGTYPTFSISPIHRSEIQTTSTATTGIVSFTYANTYTATPNVQYNLGVGTVNKETITPQTSTNTGCSFLVQLRADVLGLLPSYTNVSGREVNIQIIEK